MALNTKAIKQRIKSVKNTRKITRAMELVSAVKMRKSVESALATRTYATLAREMLENLARLDYKLSPLLSMRPVKNILVILITANRGLCGSFNANVMKKTLSVIKDPSSISRHRLPGGEEIPPEKEPPNVSLLGVGRKSALFAKKMKLPLIALFDALPERPTLLDILPIASLARKEFESGAYDKVVVAYTEYKTSLTQTPKIRQLLPVSAHDLEKMLEELEERFGSLPSGLPKDPFPFAIDDYTFEPGVERILTAILPRLVESQLFQALLESSASEHSARMMAMKNATKSAGEMVNFLNITYNKARQAAITQEIAEIVGGASALSN